MSRTWQRVQNVLAPWAISYREARGHALVAAIILWTGAAVATFASPGDRNLADHLKGEDFVQIYTLTHIAFEGEYPTPGRRQQFYDRQVSLVPASAGDHYLPVYPPTAALIFHPLAALPYATALAVWTLVTIAGYACVVRGAWLPFRSIFPDVGFVVRAAAVFPPFFLLVLYGQTTLLPLLTFFLAWVALRAGHPIASGLALGLLTVKPQFALVIGPALLFGGNWRVLLGLLISVGAQMIAVTGTIGIQAVSAYARTISELRDIEHLLEPDGWRMHSIRTLTRLVPGPPGDLIWAAASVWIVIAAVRIWRGAFPLTARLGVVILATVLVNPHLFGYDAVILVMPVIWLGAWLDEVRSPQKMMYWQSVYFLCLLLLVPTALLIPVQMSVVVMLWLFWRISRELRLAPAKQTSVAQ
jgi:alpha-1,2-mannosyltransferase